MTWLAVAAAVWVGGTGCAVGYGVYCTVAGPDGETLNRLARYPRSEFVTAREIGDQIRRQRPLRPERPTDNPAPKN